MNYDLDIIVPVFKEEGNISKTLEEIYKRLILPFYILVISLIASSLIIEPKSKYFNKLHGLNIFLIGVLIIIISQLSLKFILSNIIIIYFLVFLPLILVLFYYLFLSIKTKFNLGLL